MSNKRHTFITSLIAAAFMGCAADGFGSVYESISAAELKQRMEDSSDAGYVILDIRDRPDYEGAHIPGAINIPLKELGYSFVSLDKVNDMIVYCKVGEQSKVACQILARAGFKDVYNLTYGLKGWNYALETSNGKVII